MDIRDLDHAKLKKRFADSPVVRKGVNRTDDALGNLLDDGKKIRYKDYNKFSDLL